LDRLAPAQRAGADRRDSDIRRREPARVEPAAQYPDGAGLVLAQALAGLAYWQRGIAVQERQIAEQQRQIAEQQRKRAEDTLAAATETANSLVFDLAQRFKDAVGVPATLVKDILDRALALQEQLSKSGQVTLDLKRSEAAALIEVTNSTRRAR
jgi:hypothetical protein